MNQTSFERQLFWHQINFCFTFFAIYFFFLFPFHHFINLFFFGAFVGIILFSCNSYSYRKIKKEMIVKHTKFSKNTHYKKQIMQNAWSIILNTDWLPRKVIAEFKYTFLSYKHISIIFVCCWLWNCLLLFPAKKMFPLSIKT